MKCLVVEIRNAGIFIRPERSNDKVFDLSGKTRREDAPRMNIPAGTLSARHISNLLHVLMGERPVPSLRKSIFTPIPSIVALAKNARVRIHTPVKNGRYDSTETKTVRKSVPDSWNKATHSITLGGIQQTLPCVLTWRKLEEFLGSILFGMFCEVVRNLFGEELFRGRVDVALEKLSESKSPLVQDLIQACEDASKSPIAHFLRGNGKLGSLNASSNLRVRRTVPSGIESVVKIDGTLYVPMEKEDLKRINKGTGTASFLEGGFAFVDRVVEYTDNLVFGTVSPVA